MKNADLCGYDSCCGCGACVIKCPKHAITLQRNQNGFTFPEIDSDACIDCQSCIRTCAYKKEKTTNDFQSFACVNCDENLLHNSSSGGAFSAIAAEFIKNGGYVVGAEAVLKNGKITVKHIVINQINDLHKLQGSKYVQSDTADAFREVGDLLKKGKCVLFSGTPCQVDAIKSLYLNSFRNQLFSIDLICHGVPNQQILNAYLNDYQRKKKSELKYIDFRNKKYGWGLKGIVKFADGSEEIITPLTSSYYRYFLDGEIYRDNCYSCPYANLNRVGDITIGDYWGAKQYSPELFNDGHVSEKNGVSCLLVNNGNGGKMLDLYGENLSINPVDINKILIVNTQLKNPATHTEKREKILKLLENNGYASVENYFKRECIKRKIHNWISRLIPLSIKIVLRKLKNLN